MTPLHLGALHPVEQAVTAALAFGPFLILGVVIAVLRRREGREESGATGGPEPAREPDGPQRAAR